MRSDSGQRRSANESVASGHAGCRGGQHDPGAASGRAGARRLEANGASCRGSATQRRGRRTDWLRAPPPGCGCAAGGSARIGRVRKWAALGGTRRRPIRLTTKLLRPARAVSAAPRNGWTQKWGGD